VNEQNKALRDRLERAEVRASAQRLAIAQYVLSTKDHPSAEQVQAVVHRDFPMVSRATVYNTLKLFVRQGLLKELVLKEGSVVYDPNVEPHHHFVAEDGTIDDIPWSALTVDKVEHLQGIEVRDYMVVVRGTRKAKS
jgi:Fur family iron response transcriptional regulator